MPSFVQITLDTKAPEIEIYIPSYTTNDLENEITIQSNETLGDYQEVYVIDSNGDRYDYTFSKYEDKLVGLVKFSNLPLGMATIYARVDDEVDNLSDIIYKSFTIKEALTLLKLDIRDRAKEFLIRDYARKNETKDISRRVETNEKGKV